MIVIRGLIAALAVYALGWLLLGCVAPRLARSGSRAEAIALAYPLGALVLAMALFTLGFSSLGIGLRQLAPLWPILILLGWWRSRSARPSDCDGRRQEEVSLRLPFIFIDSPVWLPRLLLAVLGGIAALTALGTVAQPIIEWDAVAIWSMRAQVIFGEGNLREALGGAGAHHAHADYPLLLPLLETWGYLVMGELNDWVVKILLVPFLFSLAVFVYLHARRLGGAHLAAVMALLATAFPASLVRWLPGSPASAYADFPLAVMFAGGAVYLHRALSRGRREDAVLASLLGGAALWTKNEGSLFLVLLLTAMVLSVVGFRREGAALGRSSALLGMAAAAAVALPWWIVREGLPPAPADYHLRAISPALLWNNAARVPFLAQAFLKEFLDPTHWFLLWPMVLLVLLWGWRRLRWADRAVAFILGGELAGYFLVYWVTHEEVAFLVATSLRRLVLQVAPLGVVFLASGLARLAADGAPASNRGGRPRGAIRTPPHRGLIARTPSA